MQGIECARGWRRVGAVLALLWLSACGGGGGGGSEPAIPPVAPENNDIGARMSTTSLRVERDAFDRRSAVNPTLTVSLLADRVPTGGYFYGFDYSKRAINFVGVADRNDAGLDFQVLMSSPGVLPAGSYEDTITVRVCMDRECARAVRGSPFTVTVRLDVGYFAPTEAGIDALQGLVATTLSHDVVDATYSRALDAVVSVSQNPTPALHVYGLANGQSRSIALATAPRSVSLAPDGYSAAVGHDAAISTVDLRPQPMVVRRLPLSMSVGQVVHDGQGRVHAFGNQAFSHNEIRTLDLGTGTEVLVTPLAAYGGVHATLHPDGDRLYFASRSVSPSDIFVMKLPTTGALPPTDSIYHGDYTVCDRVWLLQQGARLVSACGNTFSTSTDSTLDMRYAGALSLPSAPIGSGYRLIGASSPLGAPSGEIVSLEQLDRACQPLFDMLLDCFTRVARYDGATLALRSRLSLPPVTVGTDRFAQTGRFIFHRDDGRAVLLTELRGAPAAASIRLNLLP